MITHEQQLIASALDAFKMEYAELSSIWHTLDTKAQGNIAVCGIFVAGLLVLAGDGFTPAGLTHQWTLSGALACLLVSILLSIWALKVESVASAPLGHWLAPLVEDLLGAPDLDDERMADFALDQCREWKKTNNDVQRCNDKKAARVFAGQVFLVVAVLLAIAETFIRLWC